MNNALIVAALAVVSMGMTACMPRVNQVEVGKQESMAERALSTPHADTSNSGSLWYNGGIGLLSDPKAGRVGDLVTVLVSENAKATRSLASKQSKKSSRKAGLSASIAYGGALGNKDVSPTGNLGMTNSKSFDGSGSTNNSDTLTASVTSVVTYVYPNGNMRINGKRVLIVNHEPQELTFSGVIRPIDITATNTIQSSKVAQARISYGGTGALAAVAHEGWLSRTLDMVWPF